MDWPQNICYLTVSQPTQNLRGFKPQWTPVSCILSAILHRDLKKKGHEGQICTNLHFLSANYTDYLRDLTSSQVSSGLKYLFINDVVIYKAWNGHSIRHISHGPGVNVFSTLHLHFYNYKSVVESGQWLSNTTRGPHIPKCVNAGKTNNISKLVVLKIMIILRWCFQDTSVYVRTFHNQSKCIRVCCFRDNCWVV